MTDDLQLPVKLETVPLYSATFEIRFTPAQQGAAELLPGVIFTHLGKKYGRSVATPVASLPQEIRGKDPRFRYQAHYRLVGDGASVFVGEEVAGLNQGPPYEGSAELFPRLKELIQVLKDSGLIDSVDRFSMKFMNVLPGPEGSRLDQLNFDMTLADFALAEAGMDIRAELNDEKYHRIIQIAPQATVQHPEEEPVTGLMLSLDCIKDDPPDDFLANPTEPVEEIHVELKRLFFSIITDKTLELLGPEYA